MGKAKTKGWAAKSQFEISVLVAKSVVMLLYSYGNINYMDLIIPNLPSISPSNLAKLAKAQPT